MIIPEIITSLDELPDGNTLVGRVKFCEVITNSDSEDQEFLKKSLLNG